MCYGKKRELGRDFRDTIEGCVYCSVSETVFVFEWLCADVTHPQPLSRGEFWMLFTVQFQRLFLV